MSKTKTSVETDARHRAEMVIQVRSGMMSATEAAAELGISRKSYYQWEKRAFQGMLSSLEMGNAGRPRNLIDPEKVSKDHRIAELEKELALTKARLTVRQMFQEEPVEKTKKKD